MSRSSWYLLGFLMTATAAQAGSGNTFQSLRAPFDSQATPAYWQLESPVSPATYQPGRGDFLSEFSSPSGKQVRIVVKAPQITTEYDVPPIGKNQSVYDYLNNAFYDSQGNPRTETYIKFPKGTYSFKFPLNSNCSLNYVHWQPPQGATDLIVDGQGSTVNFSDFCLGLNLPSVNRVIFKNFTFSWPRIQIATVAKIIAVGGNGNTGYTYDVHIDPPYTQHLPNILAATNAWDEVHHHWDISNTNAVYYGNGFPSNSGVPLTCEESPAEQQKSGCTARGITSYGVQFNKGQSVLLRHYDFATAVSASGNDISFDNIHLNNLIGYGFAYGQGRGFRVTHSTLSRMEGQPISAGGNVSLITGGVTGDVVFDDDQFGYSGDDPFDMNTPLIRFTSIPVSNNTNLENNTSTPMNSFTFTGANAPNQLQWPSAFPTSAGDTVALFSSSMGFKGSVKVASVSSPANSDTSVLTLDQNVPAGLRQAGFIAADLTSSAGARYLISHNTFEYTSARALLLQTPFGLVDHNHFVGQTEKEVYVLASQYWGEGPGAQELIISHNLFDGTGAHQAGFYALDVIAESTDFFSGQFPNVQNEVAGTNSAAPAVNQNIIIADNAFVSDDHVATVNLSSVNNAFFTVNAFIVPPGSGAYPVTIHDASNVFFDSRNTYTSWLSNASCANSQLLNLSTPPPVVSKVLPNACGVKKTVSGLYFEAPGISP